MTEVKATEEIIETDQKETIDDEEQVVYREVAYPYGFIYITTNLVNGKRYLGLKVFDDKWKKYLGSGIAFKKAVKKYGRENFHRDIIYIYYSEEELKRTEYELSVFFDVVESDDWYNLVLGGGTSYGWHPSEETKNKISKKAKERLSDPTNHPGYGKPGLSGEQNPQFGVSPKERMNEDTYQQWYEKYIPYWENPSTKGRHIWIDKPNPNLGKKMSQEQKDKISIIRRKNHTGSKAVYCIELDTIFLGC